MARSTAALALLAVLCAAAFTGGAATTPEGVSWLAENGKKDGVVTLPSGLQYKARRSASQAAARASGRGNAHAYATR
jgi:FKBP-type peptidyl-prolyl cis-trans isomerase FklB